MLNSVTVGVSTNCNAGCWDCFRNMTNKVPYNIYLKNTTLLKFIDYFDRIEFIGLWGDFVTIPNGLELVETLNIHNKKFIIETNAGIRDKIYWKTFGKLSSKNPNGYVQFSIDDIKHEYDIYRKVRTSNVLDNLKIFIDSGGYAAVKTINWKFNEDSIDEMIDYFRDIGVIVFKSHDAFQYKPEGDFSCPSSSKLTNGIVSLIYTNKNLTRSTKMCHWSNDKKMMIDEFGELHQCCNLAMLSSQFRYNEPFRDVSISTD